MNKYLKNITLNILLLYFFLDSIIGSDVIQLTSSNYETVISNHEFVFLNFYADWCGFSRSLAPQFEEAASTIKNEFDSKQVVFAKIDCEKEADLASQFKISKYPTLKQVLGGKIFKNEYRGGRTAKALVSHVKNLLKDSIITLSTLDDLNSKIDSIKGAIIGYFGVEPNSNPEYTVLNKVAKLLKNDCNFYYATGPASVSHEHQGMQNFLVYKNQKIKPSVNDVIYKGSLLNFEELHQWASSYCVPLVREITFDNAEQLTEDRLPFMILFYNPGDVNSINEYKQVIKSDLMDEVNSIHFLIADGQKFEHPLHHLGKTKADLPLIVIDSFRHMYIFKKFSDIHTPNKLKQFVKDLHSGKLHREFHFGPDEEPEQPNQQTAPPESVFKNLQPSSSRYTFLKDEL